MDLQISSYSSYRKTNRSCVRLHATHYAACLTTLGFTQKMIPLSNEQGLFLLGALNSHTTLFC